MVGTLAVYLVAIFQIVDNRLADLPYFNLGSTRLPTSDEALNWALIISAVGIPVGTWSAFLTETSANRQDRNVPVMPDEVDVALLSLCGVGVLVILATALVMYAIKPMLMVVFVIVCVITVIGQSRFNSRMSHFRFRSVLDEQKNGME